MQFGAALSGKSLTLNFRDARRVALKADELEFHSIWMSDHLMHPFQVGELPMYYCHEAWTVMTALAALTKKVRLGFSMLIPGFRYPSVLAKMAASLDEISNGRLVMGVGAGWFKQEYDAYGIPWQEHDKLIEMEREAVLVMKALWTQPVANFTGRYYHVKEAVMEPKTVQKPHPPVWIGGDSPKTMELAGQLGDGWFSRHTPPQLLKEKINSVKKSVGERPMEYATSLGDLPSGKDSETVDEIQRYAKAGVTLLTILFQDANALQGFAERILPSI